MPKDIIINGLTIKPGQSVEANLNVYRLPTRTFIEIPVHVFRSAKPGPVVLFIAGMHGDETNGIEIIRRLVSGNYLNNLLKGSVIAIPIFNIVSFINSSRELPDGRDLNRCFPGSPSGSFGSRLANDLMEIILPQIDLGVDFHTGGAKIKNYPQVRCVFDDEKSLSMAKLFGAPITLNSPYRDKTFRKEAFKKGKPILVYEAGESQRLNKIAIAEGMSGSIRLLKNLGMINVEVTPSHTKILSKTRWVRAKMSGIFNSYKGYGAEIKKGDLLGSISDPFGDTEVNIKAQENGYIVGINNQPIVHEGDALIHIGVE